MNRSLFLSSAARIVLAVLVMVIVVVMGKISVAGAQPVTNRPAAVSQVGFQTDRLFQEVVKVCVEGVEEPDQFHPVTVSLFRGEPTGEPTATAAGFFPRRSVRSRKSSK